METKTQTRKGKTMTILLGRYRARATGKRYWYSYKRSWGHTYYSFDDERTWHRGTVAAFCAAEASGLLRLIK